MNNSRFTTGPAAPAPLPPSRRHWLLEPQRLLLVLLVVGIYFIRLDSMSLRGEETRRATIAAEMIDSGDWVVPTQQGQPYLTRPPLQNWAIAVGGLARGQVDTMAVRLPSALAVLLTALLVYGYARLFMNPLGALASGTAFATFGQVMELGGLGESDAMLTLFVAAALLLWHGGRMRGRSEAWCWMAGYAMAALGFMTKGPQAPVYFAGPVFAYLLLSRRWRELVRWQHLAGIAVFAVIVGAWFVPFAARTGTHGVLSIFGYEVGVRLRETGLAPFLLHLVEYPASILFGSLMPWSVLLVAYVDPKFRRALGRQDAGPIDPTMPAARVPAVFLATAILVTFPTVWLVPGAESRLYLSMFPMIAPLIGLVVQRCYESVPAGLWEKLWRPFAVVITVIGAGICLAAVATAWIRPATSPLIQAPSLAIAWMAGAAVGAVIMTQALRGRRIDQGCAAVMVVATLTGMVYAGPVMSTRINSSVDAAGAVAHLKSRLPAGVHLVSLGRIHHLFSYYYGEPIELRRWPVETDDVATTDGYFCFDGGQVRPELPLAWEKIAVISCDRSMTGQLRSYVVIGRWLPGRAAKAKVAR